MKYSELKQIVERQAAVYRRDAALTGSCGDGGSDKLLNRLSDFKNSLVVRYDLKPSEFRDLDNIEVGEPGAFTSAIYNYRKEQSQKKMRTFSRLPKNISNEAYKKANEGSYEDFVEWWDSQIVE